MGKLINSPDNKDTSTDEKNPKSTTSTNYGSNSSNVTGVNTLIYILFITSLGFSVYTYLRQAQYEDRIRQIHLLDERISMLEGKLRLFPIQFLNSLATSSTTSQSTLDSSTQDVMTSETESNADDINTSNKPFAHVLQKLSLQLSGIQRLRRDVSHLKASKRNERQASVQQTISECTCPPGK